jgi:hypothetical protein
MSSLEFLESAFLRLAGGDESAFGGMDRGEQSGGIGFMGEEAPAGARLQCAWHGKAWLPRMFLHQRVGQPSAGGLAGGRLLG